MLDIVYLNVERECLIVLPVLIFSPGNREFELNALFSLRSSNFAQFLA